MDRTVRYGEQACSISTRTGYYKTVLFWLCLFDFRPFYSLTALQEEQHAKRREKLLKGNKNSVALSDDPIHNDFKREMLFYRQAQATVIESFSRLKNMGVPTKRPDDYFAQMMKTDDHMQKIRTKLAEKQDEEERVSKIRKLRELKKFGKKVQVEVQQKRQKEKKDMLDQVKKFRKGKTDKIDFLDDIEATNGKKPMQSKKWVFSIPYTLHIQKNFATLHTSLMFIIYRASSIASLLWPSPSQVSSLDFEPYIPSLFSHMMEH